MYYYRHEYKKAAKSGFIDVLRLFQPFLVHVIKRD